MKTAGKLLFLLSILLIAVILLVSLIAWRKARSAPDGSNTADAAATSPGPLRVAFGVSSTVGDFGWSHGQNQGRLALKASMLDSVETLLWEGVYETNGCERALAWFTRQQPDLAFVLGERNQLAIRAWTQQHPTTKVVQWYGTPHPPNLAACSILDYETAYLCGAVAAMTPETGQRLGVLAPYGSSLIRWVANAFTLGARSIRGGIEVEFRVLGSWYDPEAEREAIRAMTEGGAGAVYLIAVAPVPGVEAAEQAGTFVLSHFGDQSQFAPTRWLTGTERLWVNLYRDVARRVQRGTWEPTTISGGLKERYVRLASFGPAVTPDTIARVRELSQAIISGQRPLFRGPLRDAQGELRVPAGDTPTWSDLVEQRWMVEGVVPSLDR